VRCGECLRACPTNTLQPDWHHAGLPGLWAPRMNLRHAACDQDCNACGQVCPTQCIRPLDLEERRHARVGVAIVRRDKCLPWGRDEQCLVCEQQCPYGAIAFQHDDQHRFGLPVVDTSRCNGCGICEDRCPLTGDAAIVVVPDGELRLAHGSYVEECGSRDLIFERKDLGRDKFQFHEGGLPLGPD
jgi:NAD-dependent dihydropyrimidine dehydrogenase PreA subunit